MPNLRSIADQGIQFVNHYTNSPQCVPGRTCHFTGRRTDQIHTWSNEMGIALYVNQSLADPHCVKYYGNETCFMLGAKQNVNYTLLSGMEEVGYEVYLYGRMDVGAVFLNCLLNHILMQMDGIMVLLLSLQHPQQIYINQQNQIQ